MKLNKDFVVHTTDTTAFLAPVSGKKFSGMVRGNETFGTVIELLQNEISEEELVNKMLEKYEGDRERIASDVHKALEQLKTIGAIDE